jgi:hypothetical protein
MTAWPELEVKKTPVGMTGKPEIGVQVCVYTVKKVTDFPVPGWDVTYQTLPEQE